MRERERERERERYIEREREIAGEAHENSRWSANGSSIIQSISSEPVNDSMLSCQDHVSKHVFSYSSQASQHEDIPQRDIFRRMGDHG